jgi:8-oxo-dGTP pyrophosphatase MutT (NUDIX family)
VHPGDAGSVYRQRTGRGTAADFDDARRTEVAPIDGERSTVLANPRDASTVIICRDSDAGIEVYLLRRSSRSTMIPDAYVFPGGILDNSDKSPQARMRLTGEWRPAEPAFTYAAIREAFESCGLLYSTAPVAPDLLREARTRMIEGKRTFGETLIDLDARLDATAVRYFSRWITPPVVPQRFDARFFIARVPADQIAERDAVETYDGSWWRPADALAAVERDEMQMVFPAIKHLERIRAYATVNDLFAFADTKKTIPVTPDVRAGPTFFIPPALENTW